jgi:hypothetical protein
METQMSSIQPPVFRMSLFNHEDYKQWWKTVNWEKTHLPQNFKRIPSVCTGISHKYVDGRVVYHDGSIERIERVSACARLCSIE